MPTLSSSTIGPMSSLLWSAAAARVAGAVGLAKVPDGQEAARDALEETLQDWDTRRDWKFTQVVAPDITLAASATTFDLPTTFKKPYVAYLVNAKQALTYVERANWHRVAPAYTAASIARYYTLFNDANTGKGDIFPPQFASETMILLYYREIIYRDADDALLDIPKRWEVRILDGAKARICLGKHSQKSDRYFVLYEEGLKKAKEDDQRVPDQFVSFQSYVNIVPYANRNVGTTISDGWGVGWGEDWGS